MQEWRFLHGWIGLLQESRFRASKSAESRRGKVNMDFPPDPLVLLWS